MKVFALCFLVVALSVQAQPSPYRLLRPIMKDPNHPQAPSSVTARDLGEPQQPQAPQQVTIATTAEAKPAVIVAKIDKALAVSPVSLMARVTGLKGTIYVTNLTGEQVLPTTEFAVLDAKGFKIGEASRLGSSLPAYGFEKIDVVATNVGSADLKLMKLSLK